MRAICPKCSCVMIQDKERPNKFWCVNLDCPLEFALYCFKCELPKTLCICGMESIGYKSPFVGTEGIDQSEESHY